jgi:bifunctional non-homologous end joining protein LigD
MRAVTGPLPAGTGWAYEVKWDGMRAIVSVQTAGVRAFSSRGADITVGYPELGRLEGAFGTDVVLDGELVALADGVPSFAALQQRMHLADPGRVLRRAAEVPVVFMVFDVLRIGGTDTVGLAFADRRRLLDQLVEPGPTWRAVDSHVGGGDALLAEVRGRGLEGVVAKRLDATYEAGRRSAAWVKVKVQRRQEMVVGGWVSGEGSRADSLGSLLIGHHDADGLRFAGTVGSGIGDTDAAHLRALLDERATDASPFADPLPRFPGRRVHHSRPEVVVEVAMLGWTPAGKVRHPVYLGRRFDVDPSAVVREEPDAPTP